MKPQVGGSATGGGSFVINVVRVAPFDSLMELHELRRRLGLKGFDWEVYESKTY